MPRSYCKPHYLAAFALRGKYDDIGKEAAAPPPAAPAEAPPAPPPEPSSPPQWPPLLYSVGELPVSLPRALLALVAARGAGPGTE